MKTKKKLRAFDWSSQCKKPFYDAAQKIIDKAGMQDITGVDRTVFVIAYGDDEVRAKIYLKPLAKRKGNHQLWKEILKTLDVKDETPKRKKKADSTEMPLFYSGCFVFSLREFGFKYR